MRRNQLQSRPAFTIVELLVVVSIMSLLIALLLPALLQSRNEVRTVHCMNNYRQILTAVRMYADENEDMAPFTNWLSLDAAWRDKGGAGWLYKYPASYPNPFLPVHREGGTLWTYIPQDETYHCPLDAWRNTGPTNTITSYVLNGSINSFGNSGVLVNGVNPHRLWQFKPNALFYWEVDETAPPNYYNDGSSAPNEKITQRHAGDLIIGIAGGGAERIAWDDYQIELLQSPGRFWNNPMSTNGH